MLNLHVVRIHDAKNRAWVSDIVPFEWHQGTPYPYNFSHLTLWDLHVSFRVTIIWTSIYAMQATKHHPASVDLELVKRLATTTKASSLQAFLVKEFWGISKDYAGIVSVYHLLCFTREKKSAVWIISLKEACRLWVLLSYCWTQICCETR